MKKALFAILACCLAVSSAIAQVPFDIQLSEDHPHDEVPIEINGYEQGHIFINIQGEPDYQGRTPVRIELENRASGYDFLLCDRSWNKKDLQKQKIIFDKGYAGKSTLPVDRLKLDGYQDNPIPCNTGRRYTFPDIFVVEGEIYECKIPIHLLKPAPGLFCKNRKKLHSMVPCVIRISVDTKDTDYETLQFQCDSLRNALDQALDYEDFCTHPRHDPSFEEQIEPYLDGYFELKNEIFSHLDKCPKESKKYKRYEALLDTVYKMEEKAKDDIEQYRSEKHDCGGHKIIAPANCKYCTWTLEAIWKRMSNLYFDLRNTKKTKEEALKEARALYNCCTNHKKQERQWKTSEYKKGIEDYYNSIKNY